MGLALSGIGSRLQRRNLQYLTPDATQGAMLASVGRCTCVQHPRGFIMDQAVLVAIARFPDRGHAIEELASTDEDFRSLCADLADAEAAPYGGKYSPLPVRAARSTEYRDLARDLAAELAATLDRHAQ